MLWRGGVGPRYTPEANGEFAGQTGYGYISIAHFIEVARGLNGGALRLDDVRREGHLVLVESTVKVRAAVLSWRRVPALCCGGGTCCCNHL